MDHTGGAKDTAIWNIYYHLYLDSDSLHLLHTQADKLLTLSLDIQSWHGGEYGRLLRFCDHGTFLRIREFWKSYSKGTSDGSDSSSFNKRFKSAIQRALDMKNRSGPCLDMTGYRSAAPVSLNYLQDAMRLPPRFWEHGITDGNPVTQSESIHANPMFSPSMTDTSTLHYGTDPLLGFHLATAYTPLSSRSPLKPSQNSLLDHAVEAARCQFREWSKSFREYARDSLTIRFFAGDALAFCHTLQHRAAEGVPSANWYRDMFHLEPLVLDGEDYAPSGVAPLSFNVIDTSNLVDHVGAINLLVAASPLLEDIAHATLYAESLVKREKDLKALVDNILCGHFPTISVLFGLVPVEYWTNATAISSVEEALLNAIPLLTGGVEDYRGQMYSRLTWKRPLAGSEAPPVMHFEENELAQVLFRVYLKMFEHENLNHLLSNMNMQTFSKGSLIHYQRSTVASLLLFVKKRVIVDWNKMMDAFLGALESDSSLMMSTNYIQELYLQLHLLGLYSVSTLSSPFGFAKDSLVLRKLSSWTEPPAAVCITLKVPRAKLQVFTKTPHEILSTPIVHCILQSSSAYSGPQWQNIFAAVQLAFGEITSEGTRYDENFRLNVLEDEHGWNGRSSLLVTFMAPTWVVLLEPQACTVSFGLQSTPFGTKTFLPILGLEMNVYKTPLGNESSVYVTKYPPNLSGHTSVGSFMDTSLVKSKHTHEDVIRTIKANVDLKTTRMTTITGRVDIVSEKLKADLSNGAAVNTIQRSPWTIAVTIGTNGHEYQLHFPAPVLCSRSRSRIARKSSYIEVVAPMADPTNGEGLPGFMFPTFIRDSGPVVWNMPRLNINCLPILDTSRKEDLQWLTTHTSLMFSATERDLKERSKASGSVRYNSPRMAFKDSLFSLFMHSSGLQGNPARLFGINNPANGGIHILIFVSHLRLDLANHTVVLDAAILPLSHAMSPTIDPLLRMLPQVRVCSIKVDDEELKLWKEMVPVWVERSRDWEHRPSCEYQTRGKIPLSTENGQSPICTCGHGTVPNNFVTGIPKWNVAAEFAVRVAISPSFSVPFVEHNFEGKEMRKFGPLSADGCRVCHKTKTADGMALLRCSRCHDAKYCSAQCQRSDWKDHKKVCAK